MIVTTDPKQVERLALRDSLQDGLLELASAALCLILTVLVHNRSTGGFWPLSFLAVAVLHRALKQYVTYPRLGYVKFPLARDRGTLFLGLLVIALLTVAANLFLRGRIHEFSQWLRWLPLVFGILHPGFFVPLGIRSGLARFHVFAALSLAGGLVFSQVSFPAALDGLCWYLGTLGAVLGVWGGVLFAGFLRRTDRQSPEAAP